MRKRGIFKKMIEEKKKTCVDKHRSMWDFFFSLDIDAMLVRGKCLSTFIQRNSEVNVFEQMFETKDIYSCFDKQLG